METVTIVIIIAVACVLFKTLSWFLICRNDTEERKRYRARQLVRLGRGSRRSSGVSFYVNKPNINNPHKNAAPPGPVVTTPPVPSSPAMTGGAPTGGQLSPPPASPPPASPPAGRDAAPLVAAALVSAGAVPEQSSSQTPHTGTDHAPGTPEHPEGLEASGPSAEVTATNATITATATTVAAAAATMGAASMVEVPSTSEKGQGDPESLPVTKVTPVPDFEDYKSLTPKGLSPGFSPPGLPTPQYIDPPAPTSSHITLQRQRMARRLQEQEGMDF